MTYDTLVHDKFLGNLQIKIIIQNLNTAVYFICKLLSVYLNVVVR